MTSPARRRRAGRTLKGSSKMSAPRPLVILKCILRTRAAALSSSKRRWRLKWAGGCEAQAEAAEALSARRAAALATSGSAAHANEQRFPL